MTSKEVKKDPVKSPDKVSSKDNFLILHNDDFHSFDYVIKALVEVCEHDYTQASQCTIIAHYKGKCDVRTGTYKNLKPLKDALVDRELIVTID